MSQISSPSPSTARFVNTSSSSSASSNQEKWKQYAIYAAAGVVGLGVVYAGYRYLSKPALPKSTKKKVKSASSEARSSITSSSTSTSTPTSGSSTPVTATSTSTKEKSSAKRMSNDELNSAIENVLTQMSTTGQFDTDDTTNQRILKQIQAMADGTEGYTSITILNAMKYLLQWDNAIASNEDAPPSRNSQAMKDMEMAWNLLSHIHITDEDVALDEAAEVEGSTVAERKADLTKSVHFTQLEIAQRLRDAVRLNAAFIQLTSHTSLNTDDLALAFTVAPVLGRWNDTRKLGNQIQEKQPQFIELIFHGAACQRSDIPDYSVLYDWSESESKRGDVALSDIHFQTFIIRGIRKNLESLHTEHIEAHEKQQLRHQIDMDEQKLGQQFVDLPEQTNLQLVRHGAFVHMPSLSMLLTVAGPIVGDRMRMRGWLDIREVPGFAPFKQEEEYDLTKGADDIWSGTYTISQSPLEPEHKRSMRMVFRLQLRLKPGPQPH